MTSVTVFSSLSRVRNHTAITKENEFQRRKVIAAILAVIGKTALKVLGALAGDKKGREFLGYVLGIAIAILLIPLSAVYSLFGWMSTGEVADLVGYEAIYENLPPDVRERIDANETQLQAIDTVFAEKGLTAHEAEQAKLLCLSYLTDKCSEENFYERLADCFLSVNEESDLLTNISSAFGIEFSDADRNEFKNFLEVNHYEQ